MDYSKKLMLIGKLVGPLFISINLAIGSKWEVAQYNPQSGTHSFIYKKDYIIVGLGRDGIPNTIYPHDHETAYIKSANYLKGLTPILEGNLALEDIFEAHKNKNSYTHSTPGVPATIAAWAGEPKKAKEYLEWGYEIISGMYKDRNCIMDKYITHYDILDRKLSLELPFKELWISYHQDMLDNPEILRQIARNEVQRREWLKFAPYYEIEDVPYKEGNIFEKK